MKKFLAVLLACLMVMTMFTACTSTEGNNPVDGANTGDTNNVDNGEDTIVIGTISPNTGSVSVYGVATLNGVKLAVDEINAAGGILGGKKIVLNVKDDQGDPNEAVNAFNTLVADNVTLIVGAVTSGCTSAITDAANDEGVVLISAPSTADSVTTEDDYIFRVCYSDSFQGAIAAKFAKDNGFEKVGALYCAADTYSKGLYDAFKSQCEKYGIEIVIAESSATLETTEYSNQWAAIAKTGVEFVFAPYYYSAVGPYVVPQARKAGYNGIIMGADGYDGSIGYISEGSDLSAWENVLFTNHYDPADTSEKVVNFVEAFKAANNGETPNAFAALGYDALNTLVDAIESAGTADADAVRDALADTSAIHEGVTGTFTLDETGTPVKGSAVVAFTVVDGAVTTKLNSVVAGLE